MMASGEVKAKRWGVPIPRTGRPSAHFTWRECACRCCGRIASVESVQLTCAMLEGVRRRLGNNPIYVNSFCRCPSYNKAVGGVPGSLHITGEAADITVKRYSPLAVQEMLHDHEGGKGDYLGFTHLDRGPRRRWSE
jgi:uncharacterized protein YcbK (DUF882 family)